MSNMYSFNAVYENQKDLEFLDQINISKNNNPYREVLTFEEEKIKKELDNKANIAIKREYKETDFYNLSIKEITNNFLITWNNIIIDIIQLTNSYKNVIDNNISTSWWNITNKIGIDIFHILTKKDRLIYVGIMMIIISIFLYYIVISR